MNVFSSGAGSERALHTTTTFQSFTEEPQFWVHLHRHLFADHYLKDSDSDLQASSSELAIR